jgi:hypothetical protein
LWNFSKVFCWGQKLGCLVEARANWGAVCFAWRFS